MECSASGVDRVEVVALAAEAAIGAVGAEDFEDLDLGLGKVPEDPGAIAAGPLDADAAHSPERAHPAHQRPVCGPGRWEALGAEHRLRGVDRRHHVEILVRVDPTDHDPADGLGRRCDAGHVGLLLVDASGLGRRRLAEGGGQDSDGAL